MKNQILLCAAAFIAACTFSIQADAQMEVLSSGNVIISKNLEIEDTLSVGDKLNVGNDLSVTHNGVIANDLTVGNKLSVGDSLEVNNLKVASCLKVNSQSVISSGNVGIGLADNIVPLSPLTVGGNVSSDAMVSIKHVSEDLDSDFANLQSQLTLENAYGWSYALSGVISISEIGNRFVGVTGNASMSNTAHTGRSYGVLGLARGATSGWNYGVIGMLSNSGYEYGAGVFGAANNTGECYVPGRYAGYFNGQTKVNGNLYATDFITTSDARLKTNITDVKRDVLQKIQTLRPIQFNWRDVEDKHTSDTASVTRKYFSEDMDYNRSHYGFLAQEVQVLFPELVHEDGDGYLSVNYVELIPILVQAVQVLSTELEAIKNSAKKY